MEVERKTQSLSLGDGARRFAEQWPYLRYLGMGAWWAWIWLCYSSIALFGLWPEGPFVSYVGSMYLYSTPSIAVVCAIAALAWRKAMPLLGNRALIVVFGGLAAAGTLLAAFSPWLGGLAAFVAGAFSLASGLPRCA